MGNYDGAEICKLFGVYILSHLETKTKSFFPLLLLLFTW